MTGRESHHELEGEEHDHDDFVSFVAGLTPAASPRCAPCARRGGARGPGVLRVKGRAAVAGKAAPAVVQAVGPRVETFVRARRGRAGGLVVIGLRDMDRAAIAAALGG